MPKNKQQSPNYRTPVKSYKKTYLIASYFVFKLYIYGIMHGNIS